MVRTASTMLPLGTPLPSFELRIVEGTGSGLIAELEAKSIKLLNSKMLSPKPVLLMIICAHCPFVKHIEHELTRLDKDYGDLIHILAISSNSLITHPQDSPENLRLQAKNNHWQFPYLWDKDHLIVKALKAACTPDFFLFALDSKQEKILKYRGQLDDSRPGNDVEVNGFDLRNAIDRVLEGKEVDDEQKPSIGCNIKWDPGSEPEWFV